MCGWRVCCGQDKCAWTFGATYSSGSNGAVANVRLGSRDFLIQQNWVNAYGGYCALGYNDPSSPSPMAQPSPSPLPPAPANDMFVR